VAAADDDRVVMLHAVRLSAEFEADTSDWKLRQFTGQGRVGTSGRRKKEKDLTSDAEATERYLVFDRLPSTGALVVVTRIEIDSSEQSHYFQLLEMLNVFDECCGHRSFFGRMLAELLSLTNQLIIDFEFRIPPSSILHAPVAASHIAAIGF
jgi:hypothetical protein